jgi:hypothetical protein
VETGRLEAFSDGVFAIAITLLILEVHVSGQAGTSLAHQLAHAWPSYTGYVISFVTIGIMWANHHSMFRLIDRSTHGLVVANLLLLLCVSFVPFPTKVLAEHLPVAGPDQRTAVTGYRLIDPGCEEEADKITRAFRYGGPGLCDDHAPDLCCGPGRSRAGRCARPLLPGAPAGDFPDGRL